MKIAFNTKNEIYNQKFQTKNPSFGVRIPELETAIDTFVSQAGTTCLEEKNLIDKIKKFVTTIFQKENFIGAGSQNKVYDMGKYVFRIPKNVFLIPKNATEEPLNLGDKIEKNQRLLNIESYCGEALLQAGNLKILRNVGQNIPCGVPYSMLSKMSKEEVHKYYFETYFKRVTQLPQSSFDKFAEDVKKISYPHTIDFQNPNNTVITNDNKILLIDDLLMYNKYCGYNSTAKLLRIFMLDAAFDVYTPSFDGHLNEARDLFKKIVLSGVKSGLTLSSGYEDNLLINDALLKCKAKVNSEDFVKTIAEITRESENKTIQLKKTEEYVDAIFR